MAYRFRLRWHRLVVVALISLSICLGIQQLQTHRLQASTIAVPATSSTETASAIWKHGSFPVENFQSYTSPFGYRISPIDGKPQFHNGLDMAAPLGSYVRSWWTGKVVRVSDNTACGASIVVESGAWKHSYCHLKGHVEKSPQGAYFVDRPAGIQIAVGQDVAVGERIGRIGMTGRTTGPHLHWVLKHNGSYVDPALVIKEMFKNQANIPSKVAFGGQISPEQ